MTEPDLESLTVIESSPTYDGDGALRSPRNDFALRCPRRKLMAGNMTFRAVAIRVLTERLHRDDAGVRSRNYVV